MQNEFQYNAYMYNETKSMWLPSILQVIPPKRMTLVWNVHHRYFNCERQNIEKQNPGTPIVWFFLSCV